MLPQTEEIMLCVWENLRSFREKMVNLSRRMVSILVTAWCGKHSPNHTASYPGKSKSIKIKFQFMKNLGNFWLAKRLVESQVRFGCNGRLGIVLYCIVVGSRRLMPPDALQPKAYCTNPGLQSFLLAPPGVSTRDPSSERRREMADEFFLKMPDFQVTFRDLLHTVNLQHGTKGVTSFRRKSCWGFFSLKSPMASAGFEPANLGTKSQHATSRPPKPLEARFIYNILPTNVQYIQYLIVS